MLVEVMGRDTGWIALHGGLAGGAEVVLLPEIPYDPERIAAKVKARVEHGRRYSIVVVSEGARRPKGGRRGRLPTARRTARLAVCGP